MPKVLALENADMLVRFLVDSLAKPEGAELTVDEESPTVRKFVSMLEHRILEGYSDAANQTWATVELGVPLAKYQQLHAILMKAWTLAGTPAQVTLEQRNIARKRYEYIYRKAIEKEKLKEALHALDAQVKLDALDQVPEGSLEDKVMNNVITNAARATLAGLMDKAKQLAQRGVPRAIPLPPGISGEAVEETDGPKGIVIDLREAKK